MTSQPTPQQPPSGTPIELHEPYCTTREAADRLGVSLRTVQLWAENGTLEAWKTEGGHRRISTTSVDRMIYRGTQPGQVNLMTKPGRPVQRLKVLVVEDDHMLLKLYMMRIADWSLPIEVITCSNAFDALLLIGRKSPDILITDLAMPGLDGLEMVQNLSHSPFREGLEIIVVSGVDPEDIAARGGLPSRVPLLPKPIPFDTLRDICLRHLSLREMV